MKHDMKKVAITTTSFGQYDENPLKTIQAGGHDVVLNPYGRKLKKDEIVELCKDTAGIIAGTELMDAEILEKLTDLKVISRCGTGLDNIDLSAAKRLGIKVFNTPDAPTIAVAEMTIGLILNLLRKINRMDFALRQDRWEKLMGNLLYGKNVGIIGFGRIGKKVAELLKPFGCRIKYYDPEAETADSDIKKVELNELLEGSDIISIHVSTKEQIIGESEIKQIKKGAWMVNVSRGGAVDENALYHALKEGYLTGAAIDVFVQEPYTGQLKELGNVILTPHIGSYAKEARVKMEMDAVENLLKGLEVT